VREYPVAKDVVGVRGARQDAADVVAVLQQVGQAFRARGRAEVVDLGPVPNVGREVACESPDFASKKLTKKLEIYFLKRERTLTKNNADRFLSSPPHTHGEGGGLGLGWLGCVGWVGVGKGWGHSFSGCYFCQNYSLSTFLRFLVSEKMTKM
jgi:hypothetical protein